jgi:hypothetical protein
VTAETLEAKAHELVRQLGPAKLAAVVQLLEVMIDDEDDELSEEDARAVVASREYFRRGGVGLSLQQVTSECGFNIDEITKGPKTS